MRTRSKPLSAAFVKTVKTPGRYGDGGRGSHGLYLRVWIRANGRVGKSWGQRVRINGRLTNLGLGPYPVVTLASARGQALENSRAVYQGRDPRRGGVGSAPTFEEAAERVIRLRSKSWKSPEQVARQWRQLFRDYAFPVLGAKALDAITRADVLAIVAPVWVTKPPTAKRTLERMSVVMRWGMAAGHIEHNVADVGAITAALPSHRGLTTHHRAIAHPAVAGALAKLRDCTRTGPAVRLAIELAVLTAGRSVEVRGARWSEIDMDGATWTVPAGRMKGGREHRVPLSAAALAVLRAARQLLARWGCLRVAANGAGGARAVNG